MSAAAEPKTEYTHHMSVWQQGATAARKGGYAYDNPYPRSSYDFVSWHNGWAFAKHQMTKEDEEL